MANRLINLFEKIGLDTNYLSPFLSTIALGDVVYNEKQSEITIELLFSDFPSIDLYNYLSKQKKWKSNSLHFTFTIGKDATNIAPYLSIYAKEFVRDTWFKNYLASKQYQFSNHELIFQYINENDKQVIETNFDNIKKFIEQKFNISNFKLVTEINKHHIDIQEKKKAEENAISKKLMNENSDKTTKFNKKLSLNFSKRKPVPINSISDDDNTVAIEAKIVKITYELTKKGSHLFSFLVTDFTESIFVKSIIRSENDSINLDEDYLNSFKEGQ